MSTSSAAPTLRVAEAGDIDEVADLIVAACDDLDVSRYLVPDTRQRRPIIRGWYRAWVEHAIGGAGQVVMTEAGDAAAVWIDRTTPAREPDNYAALLAEFAGDHLSRFQYVDAQLAAAHPAEPHWHLLWLAVYPDRQNCGVGSVLLRRSHGLLDDDGLPAYLEATSRLNQQLFRRHGYIDLTPAIVSVADGVRLHRMWRRPVTDDPAALA